MGWPVYATTHAYVQKIPIQEAGPYKYKNDILQAVRMGKVRSFSTLPITANTTSSATKVLSLLRIGLPITQVKRSAKFQSTKHDISTICEHTATKTSEDLLFRNEKKKKGGGGAVICNQTSCQIWGVTTAAQNTRHHCRTEHEAVHCAVQADCLLLAYPNYAQWDIKGMMPKTASLIKFLQHCFFTEY